MTRGPIISLRDVSKSYGAFELGPIDLDVEPGCVVAVVGPVGSGKSTLLKMLMNLVPPDSGEVSLFGGAFPEDEVAIKQKIGYAPECATGYEDLSPRTLRELVSYFYPGWDQKAYEVPLSGTEIEQDRPFEALSSGTQRLLMVALALAAGSELLVLDEPTAGLDPFARSRVLAGISRFIADERHRSRTVVFATHAMEDVRLIADQIVFLVDGELLGHFETGALQERWTAFWPERAPEGDVPGMVELDSDDPVRIVSDSPGETAEALRARNISVLRTGTLELEEILSHLMRRRAEGRTESPRARE